MSLSNFTDVNFPYCLQFDADGRCMVLNREYKPIGFCTRDHVDYNKYPVWTRYNLTEKTKRKLADHEPRPDGFIFLYNDRTNPNNSTAHMKNYLKKLEMLARLKMKSKDNGF